MIGITRAWYWADGRVGWMASGKMFTCEADTPWGQHLINSGIFQREVVTS